MCIMSGFDRYSMDVIDPLVVLVLALAVAGLTRLLVVEKITETYRDLVKKIFGADSLVTYGVNCVFCTGWWISLALTAGTFAHLGGDWMLAILTHLAIFATAPHLADWRT